MRPAGILTLVPPRTSLGQSSVLVWGHSHGAAVAAAMVAREADTSTLKLVLESPYNNLQGVVDATGEWYQRWGLEELTQAAKGARDKGTRKQEFPSILTLKPPSGF